MAPSKTATSEPRPIFVSVMPADVLDRYASGNWKDFHGINAVLASLGAEVRIATHQDGSPDQVLAACESGATDLLMHYSFWPSLLTEVRSRFPNLRLHTRMHNPEPLQHLQRHSVGWLPTRRQLRAWYGAARLYSNDLRCGAISDSLLWISDWDQRHYRPFVFARATSYAVPYHCPWLVYRPATRPLPWAERRSTIACLAGGRDRIGRAQIDGLRALGERLEPVSMSRAWSLEVSAGTFSRTAAIGPGERVKDVGDIGEPWDYLNQVKAVAVLSGLGYGCKTTIIDALAAGCHVLVDPDLARRLPGRVRSLCLIAGGPEAMDVDELLVRLSAPPPAHDLNDALLAEAASGLRAAVGLA